MGFSLINHPFGGTLIYGKPHVQTFESTHVKMLGTRVPHASATDQEIYTEVNDKLEMSQIAQQKMQAKPPSCHAAKLLSL